MTKLEKDSNEKIKNIESSILLESISKDIKIIKLKELFDEIKELIDKKYLKKKDITNNEYYLLFWN